MANEVRAMVVSRAAQVLSCLALQPIHTWQRMLHSNGRNKHRSQLTSSTRSRPSLIHQYYFLLIMEHRYCCFHHSISSYPVCSHSQNEPQFVGYSAKYGLDIRVHLIAIYLVLRISSLFEFRINGVILIEKLRVIKLYFRCSDIGNQRRNAHIYVLYRKYYQI